MEIISLNVGGYVFEITEDSLKLFGNTRLGKLSKLIPEYNPERKQYFFNRNPEIFNYILDLYRTGSLHLPKHVCCATLRQELDYWEIPVDLLSECCYKTYFQHDKDTSIIEEIKTSLETKTDSYCEAECHRSKFVDLKRTIWRFLDDPKSSLPAKMFAVFFQLVVISSVTTYALGTCSQFRITVLTDEVLAYMKNTSTLPEFYKNLDFSNPKIKQFYTSYTEPNIWKMEFFFISFFSVELFFHFVTCPVKKKFFFNILNIFDLITCMSMWMVLFLAYFDNGKYIYSSKGIGTLFTVLCVVMFLRLGRIFRLLKHYSGLGIMYMAFKSNIKDLLLLLVSFLTVSIIFGSLVFFAEFTEGTTFPNMFISIWWAIVTMTTVGYGDHFPKSTPGCIVGTCCALCGVMFLAVPIALLASNFNDYFQHYQDRQKFISFKLEKKVSNNLGNKSMVKIFPTSIAKTKNKTNSISHT